LDRVSDFRVVVELGSASICIKEASDRSSHRCCLECS
jgi:hypothetical protein